MLIHDFVQVPRPYAELAPAIVADAGALLERSADAAYREGEQLFVRLTPIARWPAFGKRVAVDIGGPYWREDRLIIPIHWWATAMTALFPRLDADLEVAPMGAEATEITLMGRYDPPLAGLGDRADRLLLHRVAEASIRAFLMKIAVSLSETEQGRAQKVAAHAASR